MKTEQFLRQSTFSLVFVLSLQVAGCTEKTEPTTREAVTSVKQAWEDVSWCFGEKTTSGETMCQQMTTENDCISAGPLDGNNNPVFSYQICEWNGTECHMTQEICRSASPTECSSAASYGYGTCRLSPNPICVGDLTEACGALGATEAACANLASSSCSWIDGYCQPSTNCVSRLTIADCNTVVNIQFNTVSYCAWGSQCTGTIAPVCRTYGTSEEACNAISTFDCQWVEGNCIPETDCSALGQTACEAMTSTQLPSQPTSCTNRIPATSGTCVGSSYSGGEGQCVQWTYPEMCIAMGMAYYFQETFCEWVNNGCHVRSDVCTAQDNEQRCAYVTPTSYAFGLCYWLPN